MLFLKTLVYNQYKTDIVCEPSYTIFILCFYFVCTSTRCTHAVEQIAGHHDGSSQPMTEDQLTFGLI